jgi:ribosomal protein S18 acetylase RimI-like enzyme
VEIFARDEIITMFWQHASRAGFRGLVARDGATGAILGFADGYTADRRLYSASLVADALGEELATRWLEDCFEFVELAGVKDARGQGIGGALHDALLADLPHRTAILAVDPRAAPAIGLYRARGWRVLRDDFRFAPEGARKLTPRSTGG